MENSVRFLPEIDWYNYQGASPVPICILRHRTFINTPIFKCHIRAHGGGRVEGALKFCFKFAILPKCYLHSINQNSST